MCYLCALVFFCISCLSFALQEVGIRYDQLQSSASRSPIASLSSVELNRSARTLTFDDDGLLKNRAALGVRYSVINREDHDVSFRSAWRVNPAELELGAGLKFSKDRGEHRAQLGSRIVWPNQDRSGWTFSVLAQNQPQDFYIDRDFIQKKRPGTVYGNELRIWTEHALAERWLAGGAIITAQRVQERPRNIGVEQYNSYRIASRWFLKSHSRIATEFHEKLKNERGYFSLMRHELLVAFEPVYETLLTAGYGLLIERENDPRVENEVQLGTDQYFLQIERQMKNLKILMGGGFEITNSGTRGASFSGGVTWAL